MCCCSAVAFASEVNFPDSEVAVATPDAEEAGDEAPQNEKCGCGKGKGG